MVVKADNRPLPLRAADKANIGIGTVGGHALGVWDRGNGRGKVDGLFWAAGQFGDWGALSHRAFAVAAEAGYQPSSERWHPWFRAGYFHGSGDGSPLDGEHTTFFPVLPTPRVYARFPFYTLMNLNDTFVQVILRPHPKWTTRTDLHFLSLADSADLWYVGGGAFQETPAFGYTGRPSGGKTGLATLVDTSVDYQMRKNTALGVYCGYAAGGDVITNIYNNNRGIFGYLEILQRW
jgi:hypothetical protein